MPASGPLPSTPVMRMATVDDLRTRRLERSPQQRRRLETARAHEQPRAERLAGDDERVVVPRAAGDDFHQVDAVAMGEGDARPLALGDDLAIDGQGDWTRW